MVKKIVVGAHYGLRDWLAQRITAVVMAIFTVIMIVVLLMYPNMDYAQWKGFFSNQAIRLITFLFFLSLVIHAWIGVRDILMDYIKPTGIRLFLEVVVILSLIAYTAWAVQILWSV